MSRQPRPADPLYAGPRAGARRPGPAEARGPPPTAPPARFGQRAPAPAHAAPNDQDRAARFEDEKRRIIESCFAKKDDDGIALESYITHIRIVEDGAYPTSPPPPDANPGNKKDRVILVAVRKSGRVRVHKARENASGTFSIGKTWNLDELNSIQSYTSLIARSEQEQLEKEWAAGMGFIVTLGKPYYWQASTGKEKDFFIASLIKIYRKYTGGKTPELYGFSAPEVENLTGTPSAQATPDLSGPVSPTPPAESVPPPSIPASTDRRPRSPLSTRSQTSEPNRDLTSRARSQQRSDAAVVVPPIPREPLRSPARTEWKDRSRDRSNQRSIDTATSSLKAAEQAFPPNNTITSRSGPTSQVSQSSLHAQGHGDAGFVDGLDRQARPLYGENNRAGSNLQPATTQSSTSFSNVQPNDSRSEISLPIEDPSPPERRRPYMTKHSSRPGSKAGTVSEADTDFVSAAGSPAVSRNDLSDVTSTVTAQPKPAEPSIVSDREKRRPSAGTTAEEPQSPETHDQFATRSTSPPPSDDSPAMKEEEFRPGLGPMIKKKAEVAGRFRKAALAAGAFQPRQGGGAARLKAMQEREKGSKEPDGITGVVPAPLLRGVSDTTSSAPPTPALNQSNEPATSERAASVTSPPPGGTVPRVHLERTATEDSTMTTSTSKSTATTTTTAISITDKVDSAKQGANTNSAAPTVPPKPRSGSLERKRRQRQEAEISKYCAALAIDSKVLDGKGAEFNDLLSEFGWQGRLSDSRRIEDFESEIRREIGRAQATGWLGHVEQQEGKVQELARAFDKAIEECEELDGLFTLYSHELETLTADIDFIEAQSQGLQVQTANQKLLQLELQNLLNTLNIPAKELRGLQSGSLDDVYGVGRVEQSLALLYKALITIDPDIRQNQMRQAEKASPDRTGVGVYADTEIGQMRAVREKKDAYREQTMVFVSRFNQHMTSMFKRVEQRNSEDTSRRLSSTATLDASRQELWMYNALMLFVREINSYEWQTLISKYELNMKMIYQDQFRDFVMDKRKTVFKPLGEQLDALFTTQDKEKPEEGLASSAARKLTVRRGKTVRATGAKSVTERQDGRPVAWEVFDSVLQQQTKVISEEQNFVVHFFHLNSQASADFAEIVSSKTPVERRLPNLNAKQSYDPDRNMAKIVSGTVEGIYSFWVTDMQNLLEWALNLDQLQGVGVLLALEQCLSVFEETNQEFITRTIRALHDRLTGLFHKFIDEQIKAIEETKVKVNKRKGIISFVRIFPVFCAAVESTIPTTAPSSDSLGVRSIVNDAYTRILKAMWESLNFIAKDDPALSASAVHSTAPSGGDPEDKEALNYHILLIENLSHYLDEVDTHHNIVLEDGAAKARQDMSTHLSQYVNSVVRRPLGKWLDFVESIEALLKNTDNPSGIGNRPSHSRSAAKKILSAHDAKEIRKGIDTLKKRIEKHFGDVDDPTITSKSLIQKVFEECYGKYAYAYDRMQHIVKTVYDNSIEIDWKKDEVNQLFRQR